MHYGTQIDKQIGVRLQFSIIIKVDLSSSVISFSILQSPMSFYLNDFWFAIFTNANDNSPNLFFIWRIPSMQNVFDLLLLPIIKNGLIHHHTSKLSSSVAITSALSNYLSLTMGFCCFIRNLQTNGIFDSCDEVSAHT